MKQISYVILTATCGIETVTGCDCNLHITPTKFHLFPVQVPAWTVGGADYEELGLSRILIKELRLTRH